MRLVDLQPLGPFGLASFLPLRNQTTVQHLDINQEVIRT